MRSKSSLLSSLTIGLLFTAVTVAPSVALAQSDSYPSRTLTLVVPFAPGGASDVAGREMASRLSSSLGQPVVVDNRPGASGVTAANFVLNNRPDGYTLLLMNSAKVVLKAMNPAVRYEPVSDFATVSLFAKIPTVLVVPANKGIKDFESLKTQLKNSSETGWGSPGVGTAPHFAGSTLLSAMGSDTPHVAYKGSAPLHLDLLPGRLLFAIDSYTAIKPHIASGAVTPVAVIGHQRLEALPAVPTLTELGYQQFSKVLYDGWNSIDVHHQTPAPIVEKLNQEIGKILEAPDMKDKMRSLDMSMFSRHSSADAQAFANTSARELTPLASRLKP